jgi:hypothetical protein
MHTTPGCCKQLPVLLLLLLLLLQSGMLDARAGDVNYLTAAAGPSVFYVPRKFCSVCGYLSS